MLASGQIVDRYEVQALLGQGGMAAVYRVRHTRLEVDRALKILTITHPGVRNRLLLEGRVQASLSHPNVVGVTDVIEVAGQPGLLMEYVAGPSLQGWLERYRPTLEESLALFREIALGVGYAHQRDLIHRDLKPANVLILRRGDALVAKVADFGLAKVMADELGDHGATRTGMGMGTPAYMAPEQVRDAKRVDKRADIFALGCLLYELVTGVRAFAADDLLSLLSAVAAGRYRPALELVPELPEGVDAAIRGALQVDPEARFSSCEALLETLPLPAPFTWSPPSLVAAAPPPEQPLPQTLPDARGQGTWVGHGTLAPTSSAGAAGTWAPTPEMSSSASLAPAPAPPSGDSGLTTVPGTTPDPIRRWLPVGVLAAVLLAGGGWWLGRYSEAEVQPAAPGPAATTPVAAATTPAAGGEATPPEATDPTAADPAATDPAAADPAAADPVAAEPGAGSQTAVPETAGSGSTATQAAATRTSKTGTTGGSSTTGNSQGSASAGTTTAAAVETGTVRVTGDAETVRLRGDAGSYGPGEVPAGTYEILATFPGREPAAAGQVTIPPGREVVLRCTAAFVKCVQ